MAARETRRTVRVGRRLDAAFCAAAAASGVSPSEALRLAMRGYVLTVTENERDPAGGRGLGSPDDQDRERAPA